jgi:hypothetical protein
VRPSAETVMVAVLIGLVLAALVVCLWLGQ